MGRTERCKERLEALMDKSGEEWRMKTRRKKRM